MVRIYKSCLKGIQRTVFYFIILVFSFLTTCTKQSFITIGTGAVTGVFYPTGGAICRMINKRSDVYGIKATVESTAGSVYNVNGVLSGDLEFGVVQSDRQYQATHGLAEWQDRGPQKDLRSVFAIHPEAVTLVAAEKSEITRVGDLIDKRINLGNPGSGPLQNSRDVLSAFGLTETDVRAEYVKALEAPSLLQDERIDAFFYTVGHPSGNIKEATSGRVKVRIIPIEGPGVDSLISAAPYYAKTVIPRSLYPKAENDGDIPTFGVKATLVTSRHVDDHLVYAITKEVFDNFEEFKTLHPAYTTLTKENMLQGISAPIHRGALRYYREAGLVKWIDRQLIAENE
jgi:TRAP transporter TAXI family solute receptor